MKKNTLYSCLTAIFLSFTTSAPAHAEQYYPGDWFGAYKGSQQGSLETLSCSGRDHITGISYDWYRKGGGDVDSYTFALKCATANGSQYFTDVKGYIPAGSSYMGSGQSNCSGDSLMGISVYRYRKAGADVDTYRIWSLCTDGSDTYWAGGNGPVRGSIANVDFATCGRGFKGETYNNQAMNFIQFLRYRNPGRDSDTYRFKIGCRAV